MRTLALFGLALFALALLLSACGAPTQQVVEKVVEKPVEKVVKETVVVEKKVEVPVTAVPVKKQVVEFWTTDNEEYRVQKYEEIANRFIAANPNVEIRIVPIDEATVSQRVATARGANRLPALIRAGVERVSPFLADGILDTDIPTKAIKDLGENTFYEGTLRMVRTPDGKAYGAVPFDGWLQAIWFRSDEFKKLSLKPPVSWNDIKAACEAIKGKDNYLYGITLGTDPGQNYGHQVFEQFAMSNAAFPFDKEGKVTMNTPQMIEALDFYTSLQKCAAPGPNYWKQAREFYITGQSPMLFYSTYVMDDLAGLQKGVEPTVKELSNNTGFAPEMIGKSGDKATYGTLVTNIVFKGAPAEATTNFLKFMLTDQNYIDLLFLAPNGKIPVRKTAVEAWSKHDIFKSYPKEVLDTIANGYNTMQRWTFATNDPIQRAVIGDMEGRLLVPQAISNIIQGQMTPKQAADWLQQQTEQLLKDRQEKK
ncbi:MAG: hypothetical protein A2Z04_08380 [Chloroflexi bacterium RBG_16_57_9]|nr:MAG: hypothetical protein A2Z04_08380 [Chloroflexi bacterium RBG_16_57_9]